MPREGDFAHHSMEVSKHSGWEMWPCLVRAEGKLVFRVACSVGVGTDSLTRSEHQAPESVLQPYLSLLLELRHGGSSLILESVWRWGKCLEF